MGRLRKEIGPVPPDEPCSAEGCEATFKLHRWGKIQAQNKGWFFQKSGEKWCPKHVPDWVDGWRAFRAAGPVQEKSLRRAKEAAGE